MFMFYVFTGLRQLFTVVLLSIYPPFPFPRRVPLAFLAQSDPARLPDPLTARSPAEQPVRDDAPRQELYRELSLLRVLRGPPARDLALVWLRLHHRAVSRGGLRRPEPRHGRVERGREAAHVGGKIRLLRRRRIVVVWLGSLLASLA